MIKLISLIPENISREPPSFEHMWVDMLNSLKGPLKNDIYMIRSVIKNKNDLSVFKIKQKKKYDEIVSSYKNLDGKPCWRIIFLPYHADPKKLHNIGTSWSIQRWPNNEAVEWAENTGIWHGKKEREGYTVIFEAVINTKYIEWFVTLQKRLRIDDMSELESEIVFKRNSPIHIKTITAIIDSDEPDDVHVSTVNSIRRT